MAYFTHGNIKKILPRNRVGVTPFDIRVSVSVAALDGAAVDVINLLFFPEESRIAHYASWLFTFPSMDEHATPTLGFDVQFNEKVDGSGSPDVVINNSTAGQEPGGTDAFDADEEFTDIGGKYLQLKIETAAATPPTSPVTIQIEGYYTAQLVQTNLDLSQAASAT